ncbi:MAG: GxxExxY protein [Opitutaceae bacterium]|jgi:GxxExxY protein|nr:GxxExxY protein [Opitutaceae bacterium]
MNESEIKALCTVVRNTSLAAHRFFRHGHAEKFYENSLRNRLIRSGLKVDQQVPLEVRDEDGSVVGEFFADLLIEGELILELKAVNQLSSEHTAQVLGYLRAADLEHAMLINFGSPKIAFKKFIWNQ